MSIAIWQASYGTGDRQVDREHQELFAQVNALHEAMLAGADLSRLRSLLASLAEHTVTHFDSEEALMQATHYPHYARHKQTHDKLKAKVLRLTADLAGDRPVLPETLTQFLAEWLAHHIRGEDQQMIAFFQSRGVRMSGEAALAAEIDRSF